MLVQLIHICYFRIPMHNCIWELLIFLEENRSSGGIPGPPRQLAPSKQQTTRPSVRVKSSFTNKTSTNNVIPDLGALVKTEADNKERNKRTSGRIQEDFDLNKVADVGRTGQSRRSIKGMYKRLHKWRKTDCHNCIHKLFKPSSSKSWSYFIYD